jgi:hypothetical protein
MLAIMIAVVLAVATSVAIKDTMSGDRTLARRALARCDRVDDGGAATQILGVGQVLPFATLHVALSLPHPRRTDVHRILVWWFEAPRRMWALGPSIRDPSYENSTTTVAPRKKDTY